MPWIPSIYEHGHRGIDQGAPSRQIVVAVAGKFEAMVNLGRRNSRMKDFHDILALSESFPFDGTALHDAVAGCFERRSAGWTAELPDALTPDFYADPDLQSRWQAYLRSGSFRTPPPDSFEEVGKRVRCFLLPIRDIIVAGGRFILTWPASGPWV